MRSEVAAFAKGLGSAGGWGELDPGTLGELLLEARARAEAEWPGVTLDPDAFALALGEACRGRPVARETLRALRVGDLLVARACVAHDRAALRAFEGLLRDVELSLGRILPEAPDRADVLQSMRRRLLLSEEGRRPKLLEYNASGDLRAWLRVVAVRDALRVRRKAGREVRVSDHDDERLFDRGGIAVEAEAGNLKALHRDLVYNAFKEAVTRLEARDRTLLRLHYLDEVSLDALAALHRVHRATVARWLARARESLLLATRAVLEGQGSVQPDECDSLVRFVMSRFGGSFVKAFDDGHSTYEPTAPR